MSDRDATLTGLFAHADFAPGTLLAGRFRVQGVLGVGGMGVVYRALDEALGVPVALKLLRPELAARPEAFERFRQELLLARKVSSPHVVRIHDIAEHPVAHEGPAAGSAAQDRRWLISMDLVEGEALDRLLDREAPLPVDRALAIARQVALGLGAAHASGIVHRDLKPANILVDQAGNAYVSDFGVARSLLGSGLTHTGATVGTPDYLSPEQARGEAVDPRSDLYALGLILYEMLSGELPFAGGTAAEVLGQRMVRAPAPLDDKRPGLPPWLVRLVDRLLQPQPAHRLADAAQVVAAIDARQLARDWRPRPRTGALLLAGVLGLAIAGGGAWWWQQRGATSVPQAVPLHRVVLLPIAREGQGRLDRAQLARLDDQLRAATVYLREDLADAGVAMVDSERTQQALRQLDPAGNGRADADALRSVAVADRLLAPRLVADGGGWRVQAEWRDGSQPVQRLAGPVHADPIAAVQAWRPGLDAALGSGVLQGGTLPRPATLAAYGAGLKAQQRGELPAALAHFRTATDSAPADARPWLALAGAAHAIGNEDAALAAIERALDQTGGGGQRAGLQLEAERALLEGDPAAAVVARRQLAEGRPDDLHAALQLARALGAAGDPGGALAGLRAIAERDGNDPRVWFELGKFSILQGDARRAVDDYLVRALVLYKRSRDAYGQAETVNAMGVGYGRLGQTADAEEQYRKAVALREAVGNRRGVATSLRNLAGIVSLRGEFAQAAQDLARARAEYVALGDRAGLAATETELGLLDEERGDHAAALAAYRRALQAWEQSGDLHGVAETLNHVGFAHYQLGAYDNAQVFWQQAAEAYARLGDATGAVRTTQNLGLLDLARGRWDRARERLERSLADAERQQMLEEAAVSRRNLAELELSRGHVDAALQQVERAAAAFGQRQDQRGATDAALLRVQALLLAQANDDARQVLASQADALARGSAEHRAIAALLQAELDRRRAADRDAARALDAAARWAEASGVRQLQLQVALRRAGGDAAAIAALDEGTAGLGHVGLRLDWLEQDMAAALAGGDAARAASRYREAATLMRGSAHHRGAALHDLGARALAAQGEAGAARTAREAASAAHRDLRAHVPAEWQAGFDRAPAPGASPPPLAGQAP